MACKPGEWALIQRAWNDGDRVDVHILLHLRYQPVNRWHPRRAAILRGPVVLALDYNYHDPNFQLPKTKRILAMVGGRRLGCGVPRKTPGRASGTFKSTAVLATGRGVSLSDVLRFGCAAIRAVVNAAEEPRP